MRDEKIKSTSKSDSKPSMGIPPPPSPNVDAFDGGIHTDVAGTVGKGPIDSFGLGGAGMPCVGSCVLPLVPLDEPDARKKSSDSKLPSLSSLFRSRPPCCGDTITDTPREVRGAGRSRCSVECGAGSAIPGGGGAQPSASAVGAGNAAAGAGKAAAGAGKAAAGTGCWLDGLMPPAACACHGPGACALPRLGCRCDDDWCRIGACTAPCMGGSDGGAPP